MAQLGADHVYRLEKERVHWPSMGRDIKDFVNTKYQCISQKTPKAYPTSKPWLDQFQHDNGYKCHKFSKR